MPDREPRRRSPPAPARAPIPFNDLPTRKKPAPSAPPAVPPGGYAGQGQQTPAAQATFAPYSLGFFSNGTAPRRRRRRKKRASSRKKRTTRKRASSRKKRTTKKLKRLVKGSAAAKRFMAKLRRMRKR